MRKKYRGVKIDLVHLVQVLREDPFAGVAIPGFSQRVWKIRLASSDMQAGKRGGYRVIYAVDRDIGACYLLTIYPKPEKKDMSAEELEQLLLELEAFLDKENEDA